MENSLFCRRTAGVLVISAFLAASSQASNFTEVTLPSQTLLKDAIASGGLVRLSFDGTVTLTNTIDITNDVVLDAQGHSVTIDGNKSVRLFRIAPGISFCATNLIFANGFHTGASVGTNQPGNPGEGGAILNEGGNLTLKSCILVGNSVIGGMGGIKPEMEPYPYHAAGGEGRGGAISVLNGSMTLDSVEISGSTATGGGYVNPGVSITDKLGRSFGGAVYLANSTVSIVNSTISSNACMPLGDWTGGTNCGGEAWGGGIYVNSGALTLSNTCLNANSAVGYGASFVGGYSAYGGAMAAVAGTVKIVGCQVTSNSVSGGYGYNGVTAGQGGAIYSSASVEVSDTTFSQNSCIPGSNRFGGLNGCGGAFYNAGVASLNRCLLTGNTAFGSTAMWVMLNKGSAGTGGAIFNRGEMSMTNSTVCGNFSKGAIGSGDAYGGGLYNSNGVFRIVNSTIASNSVVSGDASGVSYPSTRAGANLVNNGGDFSVRNSLIAYPSGSSNSWGTIVDGGYNICSDDSANLSSGTSFNSTDPQLMPLADNGGPTLTMGLASYSPAVDFAPSTGAPAQDQRSLSRPVGQGIDAGAIELQANEVGATNGTGYTLTVQTNGIGSITLLPNRPTYPQGSTVRLIATPGLAWYFSGWSGDAVASTTSLDVVMTTNITITANFTPLPQLTLTLATNGMGSISLNPPGGSYLSNTMVTATAAASAGWKFVGWSGDASGIDPVTLKMDQAHALTAVFAQLPAIVSGLQDLTVQAGSDVTLNIHAIGSAPLSYQWYFGLDKLDGKTNDSLSLTSIQPAMQGAYSVIVSNAYGVVTNSAYLTVVGKGPGTDVTVPSQTVLRDAIASGGLVRLLFDGTITLTNTIEITNDVTLVAGNHSVTISGANAVRLFRVRPGATFTATNVVFANGFHTGESAAPGQEGNPGEGAAIFSEDANVSLDSCLLAGNSVVGGTGAAVSGDWFSVNYRGGQGRGGAISVHGGALKMSSVRVFGNQARGGGLFHTSTVMSDPSGEALGGAIYITNATADISDSIITNNMCIGEAGAPGADSRGGALFLASGNLHLFHTLLEGNSAQGGNGSWGPFERGTSAYGGALAVDAGNASLISCQIFSNSVHGGSDYGGCTAGEGGAVYSSGTLAVVDSGFAYNNAIPGDTIATPLDGCGGALYNAGSASLYRCSIFSNSVSGARSGFELMGKGSAGLGGGIFNSARLSITNCTIALNVAQGGPIKGDAFGGGIYNTNGTVSVINATFANNSVVGTNAIFASNSPDGVTGGANLANASGFISLRSSIIAYPFGSSNACGTITDSGYNICSDDSLKQSSGDSFNNTDPQLRPLADNGGPTLTMALESTSPCVDLVPVIGAPRQDQRGFSRPIGAGCDVGAFELQADEGFSTNRVQYTLTVQTNGTGSITLLPALVAYPEGSMVRVIATPDSTSYFSGWTGDAAGSSPTVDIEMSTNRSIVANFLPLPAFSLSVATDGMGSIAIDPPGGVYLSNRTVTVSATPAAGWKFIGWSGDASGTTNLLTLKMDQARSVTAIFAQYPGSSGLHDVSAQIGEDVIFSIDAFGTSPLSYQWWFGSDKLNGYTNSSIQLKNVQPAMQGVYSVTIRNPYGSATNSARLNLIGLPPVLTITSHTNMQVVGTNHIVLSGTVSDANTASRVVPIVTVNGETAIVGSAIGSSFGFWSKEADLVLRTNVFTVVATDYSGNATTNVIRIVLDVGNPSVAIANLVSNQRCSNAVITIRGTASDTIGISAVLWRLNGGDWSNAVIASNLNAWSADVYLSTRSNTFQVFAVDLGGNASATNSVNFTYISSTSLQLVTNGLGTISFKGNKALLEIGQSYSVTASPGRGYLFSNWVNGAGAVVSSKAAYSFTMQSNLTLVANFVPNPFPAVAGNYAGLFYSTNSDGLSVTNAGYFTANVTASGAFTAKIRQKNLTYALSGNFGLDGTWATNSVKAAPNIGAALQLDMAGSQSISGQITGSTLSDTIWTSPLLAVRNTYSAAKHAPYKGQYTLVVPGADSNGDLPGGDSAMAITVSRTGIVTVNGYMGDGEPVNASTFVSSEGRWPFYGSLYGKSGMVLGWLSFSDNQTNSIDGTVAWIKPANSANKVYPQGWAYYGAEVMGSTFTNKTPLVGWTNGVMYMDGAAMSETNAVKFGSTGQITGTNKLKLSVTKAGAKAGLFSGTVVTDPQAKTVKTIKGAVLQSQDVGMGWFLNTNQSGRVLLMGQ